MKGVLIAQHLNRLSSVIRRLYGLRLAFVLKKSISLPLFLSPIYHHGLSLSLTFCFSFLAVIMQRVQSELSQQVSSLQSDGRVSRAALSYAQSPSCVNCTLSHTFYINRITSATQNEKKTKSHRAVHREALMQKKVPRRTNGFFSEFAVYE